MPGAWKVAEVSGGGEETRAARALLLEGCGLKRPDIVKWKFGDDRCFGLHGSSGSLSGSSVIISTEVQDESIGAVRRIGDDSYYGPHGCSGKIKRGHCSEVQ